MISHRGWKRIPIAKTYVDEEDISKMIELLKYGNLFTGVLHNSLEKKLSKYFGVKYVCAVSSGTAGLHLATKSLGIKEGDEVITSPFSFISSVNCILYERAKPIFVDIEEETFNIDCKKIESAITGKTKAILVPHIFGQPAEMDRILKIAKKYRLKVIEDACESIGATYKGIKVGNIGDVGVLSFAPNKQVASSEGGAIITNLSNIYESSCSLRNLGRLKDDSDMIYSRLGYNYKMNQISACLGITQLKKINMIIEKRRKIAKWYDYYLKNIPNITLPKVKDGSTHSFFAYSIRITSGVRNRMRSYLQKKGIETRVYFSPLHLQPFIKKSFGFKKGDYPITEKISKEILTLPIFVELDKDRVRYISQQIRQLMLTRNI